MDSCLSRPPLYPTGKGYLSARGQLFCVGWCLELTAGLQVEELQSGHVGAVLWIDWAEVKLKAKAHTATRLVTVRWAG